MCFDTFSQDEGGSSSGGISAVRNEGVGMDPINLTDTHIHFTKAKTDRKNTT